MMPGDPARDALAELKRSLEAQKAELDKARAALVRDKAQIEFGRALDQLGIWSKGRDLAIRTMTERVANLRINDDGELVGSLGKTEGAPVTKLAEAFLADPEHEMFLPIDTEPTTPATPSAPTRRTAARSLEGHPLPPGTPREFYGQPLYKLPDDTLHRMSPNYTPRPEPEPFKNEGKKPLIELSDRELLRLSKQQNG